MWSPPDVISKYEYARILGARIKELSSNATATVEMRHGNDINTLQKIAEDEFAQGKLPLNLVRRLPSGETQVCQTHTLQLLPTRMALLDK